MKKIIFFWFLLILPVTIGAQNMLKLENDLLRVEFNSKNGALIRLVNKQTGWKIIDRAVLGQSFELLLPLNDIDIRFNVIKGIEQKDPVIEQQENQITFTWRGMRSELMQEDADITFRGIVRLNETGLEYSGEVINNSKYPIEYVSWPVVGEITIPDKNQPLYHSSRSDQRELFPHIFNEHGYWGVEYPTSTYHMPEQAFVLVSNNEQGFIVHQKEKTPYNFVITSFELIPGYELRNTNPHGDTMDGQPVRIQFKSNRVIYNKPGESTVIEPVLISPYKGTRYKGLDIYNKEKETARLNSPTWIKQPLTGQIVSIGHGNDLVNYAKEAINQGVNILQVKGWYRESDGRLSEVPGLAEAIEECHKMGMRVVLETNWTQINSHSEAFKEEFHKYVMRDPWGISYNDSYLCPLADVVQKEVVEEWSKLPVLKNADGIINNDNNHRDKSYFCFAHNHNHRIGEITANGTMQIDALMAQAVRSYGQNDKAILGFGFLDMQNLIYDGYQISASPQYYANHRYMNPSVPIFATVDIRDARRDINLALLNRMNIVYNLQFNNNHLKSYPHVTSYGQKIESFRNRYKDYVWDAEFIAPDGIKVEGNYLSYSVFQNKKNGKKAIVVVNNNTESASVASINAENASQFKYASPENPEMRRYREVEIMPQSVVVFFEQ